MNKYLFIFTISPVQSFISQARKLQDLYAGSKILTQLSKRAAEEFIIKNKGDIIFPYFDMENVNKKNESYPNRFLGIISTDNPEIIGKDIESAVKNKYKELFNQGLKYINLPKDKINDFFINQIESAFSIRWVFYPFKEDDYISSYNNIERTLGALKNLRDFIQLEEKGRKCSLCGERNALFYYYDPNKNKKFSFPFLDKENAINLKNNLKSKITFTEGEGLCAVCFTKRFFDRDNKNSFSSIARVAMLDILEVIEPLDSYKRIKNLLNMNFDEEILYEENQTEEFFKKNYLPISALPHIKDSYKDILNILKKEGLKQKKYYAVIMLDGDNMGKWLAGNFLTNKSDLKEFHIYLAKELSKYSAKVREIIDDKKGEVIYAGGDDVLAVVNLNYLFNLIYDLINDFPSFNNSNINIIREGTASMGVVISHYKTPFSEVLKWAHKMEEKAKKVDKEKNAVGIAVLKHSGDIKETIIKKNLIPIYIKILNILLKKEETNKKYIFSTTFIDKIEDEFKEAMVEGRLDDKFESLLIAEIDRLIERSITNKDKYKNELNKLKKLTLEFWEGINKINKSNNIHNFVMGLDILDFIIRKVY